MTQRGTLATTAYERLRGDIIVGTFAPGEKLRVRIVCDTYGIGASPIREALNRLSSEGLLEQADQRGFRVPALTLQDLDQLIKARCWAEEQCLRNSIRNGGLEWEADIASTFALLEVTPRYKTKDAEIRNPLWEQAHGAFHRALISASGSSWIETFCAQMFVAAERYRHAARFISNRQRPDLGEHRAIKDAALARRDNEAAELLCEHFRTTARLVREGLQTVAPSRRIGAKQTTLP